MCRLRYMGDISIKEALSQEITKAVQDCFHDCVGEINVTFPKNDAHGEYTTAVAMEIGKKKKENPAKVAEILRKKIEGNIPEVEKIEIVSPGFLNFYLTRDFFCTQVMQANKDGDAWGTDKRQKQEVVIEYTSPNLFKPLHIGNLVGNIIGESVARLFETRGATVRRVNYPSDIGLTVAKGVWGLQKKEGNPKDITDLGSAYQFGSEAYESNEESKKEIEAINRSLYTQNDARALKIWKRGKKTSLKHLNKLCRQLGTSFDAVIFESKAGPIGRELVLKHTGDKDGVFEKDAGAIIFRGEKRGLHTRVFVNSQDLPTYEAKDIGNFLLKQKKYPQWDSYVVVTGNEQREYFAVILRAIREVFNLKEDQNLEHIATGFLTLSGEGKMSSRKGNVLTGESLLKDLQKEAIVRAKETRSDNAQKLSGQIAIAALKYQILRQAVGSDIVFDKKQAFSFEGDSGPYLQYTYARCQSVVARAKKAKIASYRGDAAEASETVYPVERLLYRFNDILDIATRVASPHHLVVYLTELASAFNVWYAVERIADADDRLAAYKVAVTRAVAQTLKNGLWTLGIEAPEKI